MNRHAFSFAGADLQALGSGALWWPARSLLCVSDLHLGKAERMARRGGVGLPPYETRDTLDRLAADIARTTPAQVLCLGDSFDDLAAAEALPEEACLQIRSLQAGRTWLWVEGNHDPGPVDLGGSHLSDVRIGPLTFRHIATRDGSAEVSGHYHPRARLCLRGRTLSRPAFLCDERRLILPAYGTYTGGLSTSDAALCELMTESARAILTGPVPTCVPMPR